MRKEFTQIVRRFGLWVLACTLSFAAHAQWTAQDSLRLSELLNGDGDVWVNQDVRRQIQLDLTPKRELQGRQEMSTDKPWMQFVSDLPLFYDDTTRIVRPRYVRLTPFSCFTRWNEDPFAVQDKLLKEKKWKVTMKLNRNRRFYDDERRNGVPEGMDPEIGPGRGGGVGVSFGFSADKLLYENFSKRGRAIKHNRKYANAWKTYQQAPDGPLADSIRVLRRLREEETPVTAPLSTSVSVPIEP